MKPRVMSLVIFTCAVGLLIAPKEINFANAIYSLIAVALGSGAAGALNMWYESDLDSLWQEPVWDQSQQASWLKIKHLYLG